MEEKLIIPENFPELINLFVGDEFYMVKEIVNYDTVKSEGGNKYRFLHIMRHDEAGLIPEAQRDFFFKMVNAIRTDKVSMDADGFAVINITDYPGLTWKNIEKLFSPKCCIFWGVDPMEMEIVCHKYSGALLNECKIVYVDNIATISTSDELKPQLWRLVKRLFGMP
ncbi:MAG: hypothetical protein V4613_00505 [Bacteroidota bacterium]